MTMDKRNWGKLYVEGDEDAINDLCEVAQGWLIKGKLHMIDLRPELKKPEDE